jgi:hypothetical protein
VCALLIRPTRLVRAAVVMKPATLLRLHRTLKTGNTACCSRPQYRRSRAREDRAATWWPPSSR